MSISASLQLELLTSDVTGCVPACCDSLKPRLKSSGWVHVKQVNINDIPLSSMQVKVAKSVCDLRVIINSPLTPEKRHCALLMRILPTSICIQGHTDSWSSPYISSGTRFLPSGLLQFTAIQLVWHLYITFRVRRSRGETYGGHGYLWVGPSPHSHTTARTQCNLGEWEGAL